MIARLLVRALVTLALLIAGGAPAAGQASPAARATLADGPLSLDGVPYGSLSGVRATLRFAPRDSLVAERVRDLLDGQAPLPGLPDSVPVGVVAVLAHTPVAFDEVTGGAVPEWRAGVAIPALGALVVPTGEGPRILDPEGRRTLRHEWAHLGLHGYLGDRRVPRWFDEGYAQWATGGFDASEAWRLRVLLALGRAPSMDSLALDWPSGREDARTAYLLAASAVALLLEPAGERGLALFLERWRAGGSFDGALRSTFGVTPGQFEEDWRRHVRSRYGWLLVLSRSAVLWAVMALVLLALARTRRLRNRERLARLRAAEVPDRPAYWAESEVGPEQGPPGV
ncbi:MAG: hypothetical protein AB7T31_18605 [Gemmatimonadales bacterium]